MSFNRRRNIFTLGDFHLQHPHPAKAQQSKRQNSDPFERDPFKIQSYNFHYAERPSYPVPTLVSRVSKLNTAAKPFETHYYNHDFTTARNDKENSTTNKFHEFRRRKFLLNNQQTTSIQQRDTQHQQQFHQSPTVSQQQEQYQQQQQQQQRYQHSSSSTAEATAGTTRNPIFRTAAGRSSTAPTTSFLRNGTNRECLQGLRPLHPTSTSSSSNCQMRQGNFPRSNSFNQRSNSRVSLADSSTGITGVRRLQKANTFIGNTSSYNTNSSSKASASPRGGQNRNPLQTIHVSTQNLVGCNSTSSGCQINIRIKGLDDKTLGENVTIKIESESTPNKPKTTFQSYKPQAPVSPNNLTTKLLDASFVHQQKNVQRSNSSDTIIINKRLSKFSLSERSSTQGQIRPHCIEINPLKTLKQEPKERLPSMVPWILNDNCRFGSNENNAEIPKATEHSPLLRRICNNYNAGMDDIKNMRENAKRTKLPTPNNISSQKPMNTGKLPGEHKLLNTITVKRKIEPLLTTQKGGGGLKPQGSHLSLRNNIDRRNATSPDNTLTSSFSSASQFQRSNTAPLIYTTRRSLSPLNVNINVYADKLKLLRV